MKEGFLDSQPDGQTERNELLHEVLRQLRLRLLDRDLRPDIRNEVFAELVSIMARMNHATETGTHYRVSFPIDNA